MVFSEAVTGFATGDVTFTGSTAGGTLVGTVSGTGPTYNVAVSGMTTSGTVIATIAAGVAQDTAGNANTAATFTDNTVTWEAPAAQTLFGSVEDTLGPMGTGLAGATVTVTRVSDSVVLGTDTTDALGDFSIDMTGVALGTQVLVQATATNHVLVAILGLFDQAERASGLPGLHDSLGSGQEASVRLWNAPAPLHGIVA